MSLILNQEKGLFLDLPQEAIESLFPKGRAKDYKEFIQKQLEENAKKPIRTVQTNAIRFVDIIILHNNLS